MTDLPLDVQRFISQHVPSVMQLEVLLRLRSEPDRAHSPMGLSRELGGSVDAAIGCLRDLEATGLAELIDDPDDLAYVYRPRDRALASTVDQVADAYAKRKVAVVSEIYRAPQDPLRSFSDAFRIRKAR